MKIGRKRGSDAAGHDVRQRPRTRGKAWRAGVLRGRPPNANSVTIRQTPSPTVRPPPSTVSMRRSPVPGRISRCCSTSRRRQRRRFPALQVALQRRLRHSTLPAGGLPVVEDRDQQVSVTSILKWRVKEISADTLATIVKAGRNRRAISPIHSPIRFNAPTALKLDMIASICVVGD